MQFRSRQLKSIQVKPDHKLWNIDILAITHGLRPVQIWSPQHSFWLHSNILHFVSGFYFFSWRTAVSQLFFAPFRKIFILIRSFYNCKILVSPICGKRLTNCQVYVKKVQLDNIKVLQRYSAFSYHVPFVSYKREKHFF